MSTVALADLFHVRWAVAAAALLGVGVAAAAGDAGDFSVGLSAGANQGRVDCVASFPREHRSTHLKLTAGYRLTEAVDVQAFHFGAGRLEGGNTTPLGTQFGGTFKVNGFGLMRLPLGATSSVVIPRGPGNAVVFGANPGLGGVDGNAVLGPNQLVILSGQQRY